MAPSTASRLRSFTSSLFPSVLYRREEVLFHLRHIVLLHHTRQCYPSSLQSRPQFNKATNNVPLTSPYTMGDSSANHCSHDHDFHLLHVTSYPDAPTSAIWDNSGITTPLRPPLLLLHLNGYRVCKLFSQHSLYPDPDNPQMEMLLLYRALQDHSKPQMLLWAQSLLLVCGCWVGSTMSGRPW